MEWVYSITAIHPGHPRGTVIQLEGSNGTVHAFADPDHARKLQVGDDLRFSDQVDDGFSLDLAS
jgi:hypothetical protein